MMSLQQGLDEEDQEIAWEASGKNSMSNHTAKFEMQLETPRKTLQFTTYFEKETSYIVHESITNSATFIFLTLNVNCDLFEASY